MKWERIYRIGAGLQNLGNTCFLNSTVQCLTYTPPLANYLLSKEHSRTCEWGGPARQRAGAPACSASSAALSTSAHGSGEGCAGVGMHLLCSFLPIFPFRGHSCIQLAFPGCSSVLSSASWCLGRLCLCWA